MDQAEARLILENDAQMRADSWRSELIRKMTDPETSEEDKADMLFAAYALIGNLQYHLNMSRDTINDLNRQQISK